MNTTDSLLDNQRLANVASSEHAISVARDEVGAHEPNLQEQLHRLHADFVNFRRRVGNISEQAANDRTSDIVSLLLPVLDDFDRAFATDTADAAYAEGVRLTYRHFLRVLESLGVETVPAVGEVFDPHIHEAVSRIVSDESGDGFVLNELRKGYRLNGRLLRPAQVMVANSPSSE
jgi:molecular chaperone GrpE